MPAPEHPIDKSPPLWRRILEEIAPRRAPRPAEHWPPRNYGANWEDILDRDPVD